MQDIDPPAEKSAVHSDATDSGPPESARENPLRGGLYPANTPTLANHVKIIQYYLYFTCSPNNTLVSLTNEGGKVVPKGSWSAGMLGFKGVNRSGYEAGYQCAVVALRRIRAMIERVPGMHIEILFKGFGKGREAAFNALMTSEGDEVRKLVNRVTDRTPIKIGGTRAKKTRRV